MKSSLARVVLGATVGSGVCVVVASALATGGVSQLSTGRGFQSSPVLAADPQGDEAAAWTDETTGPSAGFSVVSASFPARGTVWGAPQTISDVSSGPSVPVIAMAKGGAGVIAWTESAPAGAHPKLVIQVEASTRQSAGAPWTKPVLVASSRTDVAGLAVGIDQTGAVTAAWSQGGGPNPEIETASASAASGAWKAPQQLAGTGSGGTGLQLTVDRAGNALLVWQRQKGTTVRNGTPMDRYAETAAFRPAQRSWGRAVAIGHALAIASTPGAGVWAPSTPGATLDDAGDATVIWQSLSVSGQAVKVAQRPRASGRWSTATTLARNAAAPVIGTDAKGDLTVAWTAALGHVYVATAPQAGQWSTPVAITGAADTFLTWLTVGSSGNAVLTWAGAHDRIYVSTRASQTAGWTQPVQVGIGGFPQATLSGAGDATILWPRLLRSPVLRQVIDATTIPAL